MGDRDRSDAPTAVERPGGSSPSAPDTVPEPSVSPIEAALSTSAFDPPHDRFEMRTELGRGGMGRVDEAFDRALGRPVAIKHMLSPSGTELARFEREARITARLEHPGIVPIHDAGRSADGTPYYVMRRVDGQPLSEVAKNKTLDERLALVPNLLAVCDAVAFAHARGVIHRDIKPTNILIGPFGETLLIDWGLAREIGSDTIAETPSLPSQPDLTRAGTVAGTPGFMSPEQARGEAVDARADVFALGVTLFYVLAGRLPWTSASATEMVNTVGAGRAAAWHLLPAEVPADLRAVVEKAMAVALPERYADAGALAADLRRFITGNLVGAYAYGRLARMLRFVRRHRAAVAVGLVSLLVVSIVATISVRRVLAERDDANAARALAELRQREAIDVADGLLVDTARQLAKSDPIAAIAKLRKLSPSSGRWREAWAAATTAWFNGVPFGFDADPEASRLQIAADSRHAFVLAFRTGKLTVLDLVARSRRHLATIGRGVDCSWFDGIKTIACRGNKVFKIIDATTGSVRDLPIDAATFATDRRSRLLIHTTDQRLLELRAGGPSPTELARDVTDFVASPDLEWLVLARRSVRELRHGDQTWPLGDVKYVNEARSSVNVRDGVVTMLTYDDIHVLEVVGTELRKRGAFPRPPFVMTIASANRVAYSVDAEGVSTLGTKGTSSRRMPVRNVFNTPGGFVVAAADGRIVGRDEVGWFELGARPLQYRMIDHSVDGRFVLALAEGGDLLAWDLEGPRGTTFSLNLPEVPRLLNESALLTTELGVGIHRYSLPADTREVAVPVENPTAKFDFDPAGRWAAMTLHPGNTLIYDLAQRSSTEVGEEATTLGADTDGVTFSLADGTLWRWSPGAAQRPRRVGAFPLPPAFIASTPAFILGVAGERDVMRLDAGGAIERMVAAGDVSAIVAQLDGRAWWLAEGGLWRWDVGAATALKVETEVPVLSMMALDHGVLLQGSKSLTLQVGDDRRLISASTGQYRRMSGDLLAMLAPTNEVSVIDLVTAQTVQLPQRAVNRDTLLTWGNRIGVITGSSRDQLRFTYWELTVPREPAALQRWLATITNARQIPGSDAVAWPANER